MNILFNAIPKRCTTATITIESTATISKYSIADSLTNVAKLSTLAIGRTKEICEAIQHSKRVLASNDQFG